MKSKPISELLKKFLHEHHDALPILKDIDSLTEEELEDLLNSEDSEGSYFSVNPPDWYDDNKWRVSYGFDHQYYDTPPYDSYSEALEKGVIEFVESFYWKDKNGKLNIIIE